MHLLLKVLFCFWIQESCLSSEFMKCYPSESIYYAVVDKSLAISCDFKLQKHINQSNLTDNVIWKKNGDIFRPETVLEYLSDNNQRIKIHFLKLSESDSGIYECLYFGNKNIEVSNKIELVVLPNHTDPTCTTSKSKFYVGDNVILVCETYPYPSLNLFWQSPLSSDVVLSNTTKKNKTSSMITFTANCPDAGTKYICTMNTEEGIRFCTSTVVIGRRLEVSVEGPVHFTLNQPATLLCRALKGVDECRTSDDLYSKNGTICKNVKESRPWDFEWKSTNNEQLNDAIVQANASSNLTIQKVSNEMHRENITCTVKLNDTMGSDTITIFIDGYMVTQKAIKSNTGMSSYEPIDDYNESILYIIENNIIISIIISVIFLCLVLLTVIQCLKYLKRPANQNLQVGTMQAIINYGNDGRTQTIPLAILAPNASMTNLGAFPSDLSITSNRQTDIRVAEGQTLTRSSRPRFADTLPFPPNSIENEVLVSHLSTGESAKTIIEEVSEMFTDPLYDEINEKSLKSHVAISHQIEMTDDSQGGFGEASTDDENTSHIEYTVYCYIPDANPEHKKAIKQETDNAKAETEQYNEVSIKERKCDSVILGTSTGERRITLDLDDTYTFPVERCNFNDKAVSEAPANFEHSHASPIPKTLRTEQEYIEGYLDDPLQLNTQNQTDSSKESNLLYAKVLPKSQRKKKSCSNPAP